MYIWANEKRPVIPEQKEYGCTDCFLNNLPESENTIICRQLCSECQHERNNTAVQVADKIEKHKR